MAAHSEQLQEHVLSTAVSPDGLYVYAARAVGADIKILARDAASGTLRVIGVEETDGYYWYALAISPDGAHLYSCGFDEIYVYGRSVTTGLLTEIEEHEGIGGLNGLGAIVLSPDGAHAYVSSSDGAVLVFSRDGETGALTLVEIQHNGVAGVDGLGGAADVALSADGQHLYVAGLLDDAIAAFARNLSTGALTFVDVYRDGTAGVDGLDGAREVTLSADGAHVYVASLGDDAVAVFTRNATTGGLSFVEAQTSGSGGVPTGALLNPAAVTVSPDGMLVYVATGFSTLAVFDRDAFDGKLNYLERHNQYGLGAHNAVTVAGGGAHVYVSTNEAVALFQHVSITCPPAPAAGCRQPPTGGKARLTLRDDPTDGRDSGRWLWKKGAATTLPEFGSDPLTTTDYAFCIYDTSSAAQPRLEARAPAGSLCADRPCWRTTGSTHQYSDPERTPHGLKLLQLRSGTAGQTQILAKLSNLNVGMPPLPLAFPLRVQLVNSEGICWEATYSSFSSNDTGEVTTQANY